MKPQSHYLLSHKTQKNPVQIHCVWCIMLWGPVDCCVFAVCYRRKMRPVWTLLFLSFLQFLLFSPPPHLLHLFISSCFPLYHHISLSFLLFISLFYFFQAFSSPFPLISVLAFSPSLLPLLSFLFLPSSFVFTSIFACPCLSFWPLHLSHPSLMTHRSNNT